MASNDVALRQFLRTLNTICALELLSLKPNGH
jgi:hypothetical protein